MTDGQFRELMEVLRHIRAGLFWLMATVGVVGMSNVLVHLK